MRLHGMRTMLSSVPYAGIGDPQLGSDDSHPVTEVCFRAHNTVRQCYPPKDPTPRLKEAT